MVKDDVEIELTIEDVLQNIDNTTSTEESSKEGKNTNQVTDETVLNAIEDEMTRFFDEPILTQETSDLSERDESRLLPEQNSESEHEIGHQIGELTEEVEMRNGELNIDKELSILKAMNQSDKSEYHFETNEWDPSFGAMDTLLQKSSSTESNEEPTSDGQASPNPAGNVDMSLWEELVLHENDIKREETVASNQVGNEVSFSEAINDGQSKVDFSKFLEQTGYSPETSNIEEVDHIINSYSDSLVDGKNEALQERPYFSRALEKESVDSFLSFPTSGEDEEEIEMYEETEESLPKKEKKNLFSFFSKRTKVVHPTIEPNRPMNFSESYNYIESENENESSDSEIEEDLDGLMWESQQVEKNPMNVGPETKIVHDESREAYQDLFAQFSGETIESENELIDTEGVEGSDEREWEKEGLLSSLDNQLNSGDTIPSGESQDVFSQFIAENTEPVEELAEFEFNEELPNIMLDSIDENQLGEEDNVEIFDDPNLFEIESESDNEVEETTEFSDSYADTSHRTQNMEAFDEFDGDEEEFELFGTINQTNSLDEMPKVEYAGIFSRVVAFLIDNVVILALQLVILRLVLEGLFNLSTNFGVLSIQHFVQIAIYLLYFILFTKFTDGQTLGKMMLGIQVVCFKEEKLSWTTVLLREGCMRFVLSTGILFLGYLSILFTKTEQPADMLCSTRVIKSSSLFDFYDTLNRVDAS